MTRGKLPKLAFLVGCLSLMVTIFPAASSVEAGSYGFIETATNFAPNNCRKRVDLIINTQGEDVNAADIIITYNPSIINVTDSDTVSSGVQIGEGVAFPEYYGNIVDTNNGVIRLTGVNRTGVLNGSAVFGYIDFSFTAAANPAFSITFSGIGATLDSNIADSVSNDDLLTSVTNYNTTFPSECQVPTPCTDIDNDGICDEDECTDIDNDGICDNVDNCIDTDNDGICDVDECVDANNNGICDEDECTDIDNDGICDDVDQCIDADGNGICDGVDTGDSTDPGELPDTGNGSGVERVIRRAREILDLIIGKDPLKRLNFPVSFQKITLSGILSAILFTFLFLNLINTLNLLSTPILIYSIIRSLLTVTKRPWGLILDANNEAPIAFATIRLFSKADNKLIETKVSDLKGRYGFVTAAGTYRLEVAHPDYHFFNFELTIADAQTSIDNDVYLSPLISELDQSRLKNLKVDNDITLSRLTKILFVVGFCFSILAVFISPIIFNFVILGGYILQTILLWSLRKQTAQNWGEIIDSRIDVGLPLAHVKIYDPNNWSLVDTQMTNRNGQFGFTIDDGDYAVMVNLNGYNFPSKKQKRMRLLINNGNKLLQFKFSQKDRARKLVYVDPTANAGDSEGKPQDNNPLIRHSKWQEKTGIGVVEDNLASPFGD